MSFCVGRLYKSPPPGVDKSSPSQTLLVAGVGTGGDVLGTFGDDAGGDDVLETRREDKDKPADDTCQKTPVAGGDGDENLAITSSTSWDDLPNDCWEAIFYRLDDRLKPVSVVCKRFLSMSNACRAALIIKPVSDVKIPSSLYTRFPNLNSLHVYCTRPKVHTFVRQLAVSSLPLKSLRFYCQTRFPAHAMGLLGRNMRDSLRSLVLQFRHITDEDLFVIANNFPYLHGLDLQECGNGYKVTITDEAFKAISMKLVSLVSISISIGFYHTVSSLSIEYLSANCRLLSDFKGRFLGWNGIDLHCFSSFRSLTCLDLHNVYISNGGLLHLSRAPLKLEKLILAASAYPNDIICWPSMCRFLKSCNFLRRLHLLGFNFSPCDFGASIPQSVQVIRLTSCTNVPDNTLFKLLKTCPNLGEIEMCNEFVKMEHEDSFDLPDVHYGLKKLLLTSSTLSDETLKLICSVCPNLELFQFHIDNFQVTKQAIEAMIKEKWLYQQFCGNGNFRLEEFFSV